MMTAIPLVQSARALTEKSAFYGAALTALSLFIILGAWGFQLIGGLAPCPLCLEQRVPWYILIPVATAVTFGLVKAWPRQVLMALFAIAIILAVWAAYMGLYHAGVEYKWWPGPSTCTTGGGAVDPTLDLEQLGRTKVPMCDIVPWSLLGISLAGFNFLFSLIAAMLATLGLMRTVRENAK
ncbi:MAG: disulfide bond formation protein B [Micropepsaceae bacterium]